MKDIRGGLGYVMIKDGSALFVRLESLRLVADQRWPERTRELEQAADGYSERFRVRIEGVVRALGLTSNEQASLSTAAADRRLLTIDFIARPRNLIADWVYRVKNARLLDEPIRRLAGPGQAGTYEIAFEAAGWSVVDVEEWYQNVDLRARFTASASGGQGDQIDTYSLTSDWLGAIPGWVRLDYEAYDVPDQFQLIYDGQVVADTGGLVAGAGSLYWYYPAEDGKPTTIDVRVYAPNSGTAWNYTFYGPDPDDAPPGS